MIVIFGYFKSTKTIVKQFVIGAKARFEIFSAGSNLTDLIEPYSANLFSAGLASRSTLFYAYKNNTCCPSVPENC